MKTKNGIKHINKLIEINSKKIICYDTILNKYYLFSGGLLASRLLNITSSNRTGDNARNNKKYGYIKNHRIKGRYGFIYLDDLNSDSSVIINFSKIY